MGEGIFILYQILGLISAGIIVWILYRFVKSNPEELSRDNVSKSFSTMGFLGLILIAFVAMLVWLVRSS